MIARITSLAYTPAASLPVTSIRRVFGRASARHWVASTSRTCEVPMPNATAPNAPCVEVWLSPHAIVMPGWVSPSSGPITCTMPWWPDAASNRRMPFSRVFCSSAVIISSASASASGRFCEWVGMMWSTVANVRAGKRTGSRPRAASRTPAGS